MRARARAHTHVRAHTEYLTRRMVNAYTEFLRVEQELSLYRRISGEGRRGGEGSR